MIRTQSILPKAGGNSGHGERNEVVQVSVGGVGKLQGPKQIKHKSFQLCIQWNIQQGHKTYRIKSLFVYIPEADIVQGLVVDGVSFVSVLHQLVHRKGGIVRLNNSVRNLQ